MPLQQLGRGSGAEPPRERLDCPSILGLSGASPGRPRLHKRRGRPMLPEACRGRASSSERAGGRGPRRPPGTARGCCSPGRCAAGAAESRARSGRRRLQQAERRGSGASEGTRGHTPPLTPQTGARAPSPAGAAAAGLSRPDQPRRRREGTRSRWGEARLAAPGSPASALRAEPAVPRRERQSGVCAAALRSEFAAEAGGFSFFRCVPLQLTGPVLK